MGEVGALLELEASCHKLFLFLRGNITKASSRDFRLSTEQSRFPPVAPLPLRMAPPLTPNQRAMNEAYPPSSPLDSNQPADSAPEYLSHLVSLLCSHLHHPSCYHLSSGLLQIASKLFSLLPASLPPHHSPNVVFKSTNLILSCPPETPEAPEFSGQSHLESEALSL